MSEYTIPLLVAVGSVGCWWGFVLYTFHEMTVTGGSWYHELQMNDRDTYWNRAYVTLTDRINPLKTVVMNVLISVALFVTVYVFTVGVLGVLQ